MRRIFFLLVPVICCILVGCAGYTRFEPVSYATGEKDSRSGDDVSFSGVTDEKNASVERDETERVTILKSKKEEHMAAASYLFDGVETPHWKIEVDYEGQGKVTVMFGENSDAIQSEEADPFKARGFSFDLSAANHNGRLPLLDRVSRFINSDRKVEIQIAAHDGQEIIVKAVSIEYLQEEPKKEVEVVYCDYPPRTYRYTVWHNYYPGPLCVWDGYRYVVYTRWWTPSCTDYWDWYYDWYDRGVYLYYYPTCRYVFCERVRVYHPHRPYIGYYYYDCDDPPRGRSRHVANPGNERPKTRSRSVLSGGGRERQNYGSLSGGESTSQISPKKEGTGYSGDDVIRMKTRREGSRETARRNCGAEQKVSSQRTEGTSLAPRGEIKRYVPTEEMKRTRSVQRTTSSQSDSQSVVVRRSTTQQSTPQKVRSVQTRSSSTPSIQPAPAQRQDSTPRAVRSSSSHSSNDDDEEKNRSASSSSGSTAGSTAKRRK